MAKIREVQRLETWYEWECPDCGKGLAGREKPPTHDMLCKECEEQAYHAREVAWHEQALANYSHLVGAVIVGVKVQDEYWWDVSPELIDLNGLIVEKDGKRWEIAANEWFLTTREEAQLAPMIHEPERVGGEQHES